MLRRIIILVMLIPLFFLATGIGPLWIESLITVALICGFCHMLGLRTVRDPDVTPELAWSLLVFVISWFTWLVKVYLAGIPISELQLAVMGSISIFVVPALIFGVAFLVPDEQDPLPMRRI